MSCKRTRRPSVDHVSQKRKTDHVNNNYLHRCLQDSGLILKLAPEKCIAREESVIIVKNIKQHLSKHVEYPKNISEFIDDFRKECQDLNTFKHYLFPNILYTAEGSDEYMINDSVIKILLSVPMVQSKLTDHIFEIATDLAVEGKCSSWIQMILRCFSILDSIVSMDSLSTHLINLLDVTSEKMVRLEIITAIPDIIGDQEHEEMATELSRFLSEDHELIPAILDCLTYLCLSDDQYLQLQKKALTILSTLTKCSYFANFVKFLLIPGRISDSDYLESVQGLRSALGWPTSEMDCKEIATSQILTALAIRNSMISSKSIATAWFKALSLCKITTDHKPFDIIIFIVLYTTTEDRQRQVENLMKKQIKTNILTEELLDEAFNKYSPIIKEHLQHFIELTNILLKFKTEPLIESFAIHTYTMLFSKLEDCRQSVICELLHLGLDRKQCISSMLQILNNIASKNIAMLKPQSLQMLTLLDRMDDMNLSDIRDITNLVCGLAYSFENSVIKDDIHIIIRKQLSSSSPIIKVKGILAGVHAVKYMMGSTVDDDTMELPNDSNSVSITFLTEAAPKEAAQIIELISRSTKQFPDLTAFFYDELSNIISNASYINNRFLKWLTDAVTNDLEQNFIVNEITERIGNLTLSKQYCFNSDSEMDEDIAINIAGLTLESKDDIHVSIISPLFQLVSTLHAKQHEGNLSTIDALLGSPVVMPQFDIDLIEDMEHDMISNILDCLIHCVNWFRELLNAFASQTDEVLKSKILQRVLSIEQIEILISQLLLRTRCTYTPRICTFNIKKYTGEQKEKRPIKPQNTKQKTTAKKTTNDDTVLPETVKSQVTQSNNIKDKLGVLQNMPFRKLNLSILKLLNNDLTSESHSVNDLNITMLKFLLKCINVNLDTLLISRIKRVTFLTKQDHEVTYDAKKAEQYAKDVSEILPKLMYHLEFITKHIEKHTNEQSQNETGFMYTTEITEYLTTLEYVYNMLTIYFKWIGFRNQNNALLKTSLRTIASTLAPLGNSSQLISLKDLLLSVAKIFQGHQKYCLQLSIAVSLIELVNAIRDFSDNTVILKILKSMASNFLSQQWKTPDGVLEKGLYYNQSIDKLVGIKFLNSELISLKTLTIQIANEIQGLKTRTSVLESMKCINKGNFPVLYRNLGTALYEATRQSLNKGLTDTEHLQLWKDVGIILKHMSEIAKTLGNRNNLSALFKKSMPILKLFLSQGMPIIEMKFKTQTEEILEILKLLQQSTRFLQSLCCHSRLEKDTALMAKVPQMRQLLEMLIYKVKAALAANNCSEAFWMGNLKNKNIRGEVIATQQSTGYDDPPDDCDDQLPEDEDTDASDDEIANPDSNSLSDVV